MFSQGSAVLGSAEAHFDSRMGATKPREAATLGLAGGVGAAGVDATQGWIPVASPGQPTTDGAGLAVAELAAQVSKFVGALSEEKSSSTIKWDRKRPVIKAQDVAPFFCFSSSLPAPPASSCVRMAMYSKALYVVLLFMPLFLFQASGSKAIGSSSHA